MALEVLSVISRHRGGSHVLLGLCRYNFCTLYMRSCQRDAARRIEISNVPASTELLHLTIRYSDARDCLSLRFVLLGEVSAVVFSYDGYCPASFLGVVDLLCLVYWHLWYLDVLELILADCPDGVPV